MNILARGGIEFLAVLLGITISLWVDENSKKKDIQLSLKNDLINIKADLENDLAEIDRIDSLKSLGIEQINEYQKIISGTIKLSQIDTSILLDGYGNVTLSFFPMGSSYLVSLNSGRINYIENLNLITALSKYYQNSYERIKANNYLFDEFVNKHFFSFVATIENKNTIQEKFNVIQSGRFSDYFNEAKQRAITYQDYVLLDVRSSAENLLIEIINHIE
tara:strand:- start:249 stop:905 length:657 start_codon:yes stop_codon:yes gene_type:complete